MTFSQEEWEIHRQEILYLYSDCRRPLHEVVQHMTEKGFLPKIRSYKSQLRRWRAEGYLQPKYNAPYDDQNLISIVRQLWHQNFRPKAALRALNVFEGYPNLTEWQLRVICQRENLVYRRNKISPADIAQTYAAVQECLKSGQGAQWGIGYMQTYIRLHQDIFCSRSDIWACLKDLDSEGILKRRLDAPKLRRRFIVKGPNLVWSVDGHDKLSAFGFQIYGIMDAYSRRVLGMFVGTSNRTTIAVQKFFLKCVRENGFPKRVRSDKGTETILMATCQYSFRQHQKPGISPRKCYAYGTSTKNQRIERFWKTLISSMTDQWMTYFDMLVNKGLFDGSKYDIIALQYLYMPVIRQQIETFVDVYNANRIRADRARDFYLPSGKPNEMYFYPRQGRNYAHEPDPALLKSFESQVAWYDEAKYLHDTTLSICDLLMTEAGFVFESKNILPGMDQPHVQMYAYLKEALYEFELAGRGRVSRVKSPRGSSKLIAEMCMEMEQLSEHLENLRNREVSQEERGNLMGEEEEVMDEESADDEFNEDDLEEDDIQENDKDDY